MDLTYIASIVGGITAGISLAALASFIVYKREKQSMSVAIATAETRANDLESKKAASEATASELRRLNEKSEAELQQLRIQLLNESAAKSRAETERVNLEERLQVQKKEITELHQELTLKFEKLAKNIFEENSSIFREASEKNITNLLTPLRERIGDFQKKVEDVYGDEARERFALKAEIEKIIVANQSMTETTSNLTLALRGDVKAQGNWGEIVLERILEASGLREGEEYIVQGKGLGLVDSEDNRAQPDVIVNLPENKHIIVDSKVSLTNYDQLVAENDQNKSKLLLDGLVSSIYKHVDGLSGKKYQHLDSLLTPDFVLMFVPIEGAFSLVLQMDKELHGYAWNKSVAIVSPTTLMATLRTVASIWKIERQNRNAQVIARESGLLYDKFVGFVSDLQEIGDKLRGTQQVYDGAMNKLSIGRGNLIGKAEKLKELGAKTSKNLPTALLADGGALVKEES